MPAAVFGTFFERDKVGFGPLRNISQKKLKAKLKGEKSTIGSLKSAAVILKTQPKQYFLVIKVQKPRGVIFALAHRFCQLF